MAQSSAWRGREVDITGLYNIGTRPLDPVSGRWLTYDSVWNSGDPDGYTFCAGGDPVNYFDPDGRFGKAYTQFQYNGGVAGYGLRGLANLYNTVGLSSSSTYISWQAYNSGSLLNMAASVVTPASYVNGYQNLQNRAENVMVQEYVNGSGNTWALSQGLSSVAGDVIGYNQIYEASFNVDRQSLTQLSGAERWSRGLMGGSQLILTGVGLKASFNPNATFVESGGTAAQLDAAFNNAAKSFNNAAETAVARNPNIYEVLYEAPISGTSRTAQRASANNFFANQLQNDAQLNSLFNQELGGNVLEHMESGSGSSYLNPPGTVWHHPFDNPNVMQLLRTSEHTAPSLQPVLHPGGVGGFGNFYGP